MEGGLARSDSCLGWETARQAHLRRDFGVSAIFPFEFDFFLSFFLGRSLSAAAAAAAAASGISPIPSAAESLSLHPSSHSILPIQLKWM